MDRTDEVPGEGICSECGKDKKIVASQDEKLFCEDCFNKETTKRTEKD